MEKKVKRFKEDSNDLLVLLIILIIAGLVVDLLSLNVLYNLAESRGLEGELLSRSSGAEDCIEDECNSEQRIVPEMVIGDTISVLRIIALIPMETT